MFERYNVVNMSSNDISNNRNYNNNDSSIGNKNREYNKHSYE